MIDRLGSNRGPMRVHDSASFFLHFYPLHLEFVWSAIYGKLPFGVFEDTNPLLFEKFIFKLLAVNLLFPRLRSAHA